MNMKKYSVNIKIGLTKRKILKKDKDIKCYNKKINRKYQLNFIIYLMTLNLL